MNSWILGVGIYFFINALALISYAWDKHKAIEGKWRTRESTLLLFGLLGPWGAVAGMHLFHHKTRKVKFYLNYLFLVLHVVMIVLIVHANI